MTRAYLGLAALDAVLLVAGFGLLWGLGIVRGVRDGLRHAGLALVLGWAAVGIAVSTALVLGGSLAPWFVAALGLAIGAGGVGLGRRVARRPLPALGETGPAAWVAAAGAALLLVQVASLLRRALVSGAPTEWDVWTFWLPKAKALVEFGGLDTGIGGVTSMTSPRYPLFLPAVEGGAFSFMGGDHASLLPLQHWLIAVAFLAALASLLAPRVRPAVLWPLLAFLALLPTFAVLVGSGLGDEALMILGALAAVCVALWLLDRDPAHASLAGVFLAAAALTKNEGLPLALVLAGTLLLLSWRRPLVPALLVLAPLAALLPWKLWIRLNDVPRTPDYLLGDLLDPGGLVDRLDRLSYAADHLPGYLFEPWRWLVALPLMLAATFLAARRAPALSVLALAPVVLLPVGLLVTYWIGQPPVDWYVATSAARVLAPPVVLAAALLPLLLGEAERR